MRNKEAIQKFVADTEYYDGWISIQEAKHKLAHLNNKDIKYALSLLIEDNLLYDETKLTKKECELGRSEIKTKPLSEKDLKNFL